MKSDDIKEFFEFALNKKLTVQELAHAYINYHGDINWGQQNALVTAISTKMSGASAITRADVLGNDGELKASFFQSIFPGANYPYYEPSFADIASTTTIYAQSKNVWCDTSMPHPINMRLGNAQRPALSVFSLESPQLFIGPYGYQCFRAKERIFWPRASSRGFSTSIERYPHSVLNGPLVVIQDQYDGGNYAHFLFDYVARISIFCEIFPQTASQCTFILGGERSGFHDMLLQSLSRKYCLRLEQFLFPQHRTVATVRGLVFFFSDQREPITHPLYMCHPEIVRLVRDLMVFSASIYATPGKLLISRQDAGLRRLVNEDELFSKLGPLGFTRIVMSKCTPAEQVAIISNATTVIAPHGMGLTPILFNQRSSAVIEIFSPTIGSDAYAFVCKALGISYRYAVGIDSADGRAGFSVDINTVLSMLRPH